MVIMGNSIKCFIDSDDGREPGIVTKRLYESERGKKGLRRRKRRCRCYDLLLPFRFVVVINATVVIDMLKKWGLSNEKTGEKNGNSLCRALCK